jgi:hypothetical protein
MMEFQINPENLRALNRAIARNPQKVREETNIFLTKGIREYNTIIRRNPWTIGGTGGGSPVATRNLVDTHTTQTRPWEAIIKPNAKYAPFVHEGTRFMKGRPWLDYAINRADSAIRNLQNDLLTRIVNDLGR